ncbi:MAG: NAD-dependent epimerase/dehydratase family protein [Acidobacteriota bacterium]
MKIFISGIAGFLGSHLADRMLALGHEVTGIDSLIGGLAENVPEAAEFGQADCGDLDAMVKFTRGCDVVVHAACTAYEGLSVFSPHLVTQNTFQITSTLLSASIQNSVKRFVFCSSMARYGSQEVLPFTEDMVCRPQDPYGIAKYAAEKLIENLCGVHGMQYVICAPHNIIGPRQKYNDPYRNVASIMINLMLQGRQPIIFGDGEQKRCFSFVQDCVYCIEQMALRDDLDGEVFNIGPDEEFVTINELAEVIADIMNFKLDPIYVPARPQEVSFATCSARKAREILGYKTTVNLRDGLEELAAYIQKGGPKRFRYHLDVEIMNEQTPGVWRERRY